MSPSEIADRPELLTADWLTSVLRGQGHDVTVSAVEATPVGTGQMGVSYRLALTFEDPDTTTVPRSLIAKLPTPNIDLRPMVAGAYRAELAFYRDLAPGLAVRVPATWFMAATEDHTSFVLLMEDLAPRHQGDQILGCSPLAARHAVINLAGLHGGSWCDPHLRAIDWLSGDDEESAKTLGEIFVGATEVFIERFAERLDPADVTLLREIPALLPAWATGRSERFALIHGDYRLDNLMFPDDDGSDVVALDWQTLSIGLPARDLAYLVHTSLAPDERREHEASLVTAYHQALLTHGVTGYSEELCFEDYRFGALQGPLITVLGAAYGAVTDRGDDMFTAMIIRSCQAIRDLDTFELI